MANYEFSGREILAGQAPPDMPVTVKGWVRTRRDSRAGISFVHVSDGSSFHPVQVVAPNTLPNYEGEVLKLNEAVARYASMEQDMFAAFSIADRGYVTETGRIVKEGTTRDLSEDSAVREAYLGG